MRFGGHKGLGRGIAWVVLGGFGGGLVAWDTLGLCAGVSLFTCMVSDIPLCVRLVASAMRSDDLRKLLQLAFCFQGVSFQPVSSLVYFGASGPDRPLALLPSSCVCFNSS